MADRVRRDGGERLVVTVQDDQAADLLVDSGFQEVQPDVAGPRSVVIYHLEL